MMRALPHVPERVVLVPYDPAWPKAYAAERDAVLAATGPVPVGFEHVGSTAVPGMAAKPIVDMMAALPRLEDGEALLPALAALGYRPVDAGMSDRLFLRKRARSGGCAFNLHLVAAATWPGRHERLMRDHLLAHPEDAAAYGALKARLAVIHADDSLAYTRAKTEFVQDLIDRARRERGLASADAQE